jgi:solute carrier family 25 iron transporter 28/37
MIAGSSAGVMEHICMFPVDTVKTRMQVGGPTLYTSVPNALATIVRDEGFGRLYRGLPAIVMGAIPSHAIYFGTYEEAKEHLGTNAAGYHVFGNAVAGVCATLAHDAVVTPLDVVKQHLQLQGSEGGVFQTIRGILKDQGAKAFFQSYPTTACMNIPFQACYFATYETTKTALAPDGKHGPLEECAAGGVAGGVGGLVSNPLDVIKTRIQTQGAAGGGQGRMTTMQIVRDIRTNEGMVGFTRGMQARVLYFIPSAAICWTTYETAKKFLRTAW